MNYGKHYYQDYFDTLKLNAQGELIDIDQFEGGKGLTEKRPMTTKDNALDRLWPREAEADSAPYYSFSLQTTYPGLLCGIGYHHEVNKPKDEEAVPFFQLGMYFDYSSGLPVIPGSSVKGALRAAVNEWEFLADEAITVLIKEHKPSLLEELKDSEKLKKAFIDEVFKGLEYQKEEENAKEKRFSIYERDIFFDAIPVKAKRNLLGEDYITHHPSVFTDPNPVRFLRVEPEVTYRFRFLLYDGGLFPAELKKQIFRKIILELGLGAKTNVGYGRFREEDSAATPDAPRPTHP
ncbi:type III-B CRISPR module RAMP protein Cmr6 [Porphyromonas sp. COT-239 OH1446]|uniref:type III-B CRISPR module RAMP protein Cmr6 n=1 Tax=Porphyromonas sp. COT-239 OH1446 TaxID=1515613 RepID=UPI00068F80A7|nr:type III-B CRISPR module RAMP protein Cmr6 [Porphyromonas sp. COT-239 OH1446]